MIFSVSFSIAYTEEKKKQATNLSDFFHFPIKIFRKWISHNETRTDLKMSSSSSSSCDVESDSDTKALTLSLSLSRSRSRSYKTQCLRISKAKIKSPEISNRLKMTTAETSFKNAKKNKEGEVSGCRVTKTELRRLFVLEYKL